VRRGAVFSPDRRYRYVLFRDWDEAEEHRPSLAPTMLFVMLNPSVADADGDDPTIRRCIRFAQTHGCISLSVVNLFALVTTDPRELVRLDSHGENVIGPENDGHMGFETRHATITVAAWGAHPFATARAREVYPLLDNPVCLGVTASGAPRHPLYVAGHTRLTPYSPPPLPEVTP
jgi:hypothetical protein